MDTPKSLDQLLLQRGLVAPETFARARLVQEETGERLDAVLTRLGLVAEQTLANTIADETGLPLASAEDFPQEPVVLDHISTRFLRDVKAVPLAQEDGELRVALIDPLDPYTIQALGFATERKIAPVVARMSDIEAALDRLYGSEHQADGEDPNAADEADVERLKDLASDAPVVRLVNGLITRASESRASDIHIEPTDDAVKVRFRVDGALRSGERRGG